MPEEAQGNALSDGTNGARQAPTAGTEQDAMSTTRLRTLMAEQIFFRPK